MLTKALKPGSTVVSSLLRGSGQGLGTHWCATTVVTLSLQLNSMVPLYPEEKAPRPRGLKTGSERQGAAVLHR